MNKKCGPWFLATWHVHSQNFCIARVVEIFSSVFLAGQGLNHGLYEGGDAGCKCQTVGHLKTLAGSTAPVAVNFGLRLFVGIYVPDSQTVGLPRCLALDDVAAEPWALMNLSGNITSLMTAPGRTPTYMPHTLAKSRCLLRLPLLAQLEEPGLQLPVQEQCQSVL